MKFFFVVILAGFSFTAQSQQKDLFKNRTIEDAKDRLLRDSLLKSHPGLKNYSFGPKTRSSNRIKTPPDMSVVKIPLKGSYMGNNGKGANIYSMQPYNMPCLVPDSSFSSKMPIAGNFLPTENNPSFQLPEPKDGKNGGNSVEQN